jgi:hypothetical protein
MIILEFQLVERTMPIGLAFIPILAALAVLCGSFVYSRWLKKRAMRETNETAGSPIVKRSTKSKVFIMSLNSLLLAVFILSAWCYYTVYNGEDPLALLFIYVITDPALLVLGIILLVYGKRFQIPVFNRLIPFIGIVALTTPIFIPSFNGSDYRMIGLVGTWIGAALSIITVAITVAIVVSKQNRSQTSQY